MHYVEIFLQGSIQLTEEVLKGEVQTMEFQGADKSGNIIFTSMVDVVTAVWAAQKDYVVVKVGNQVDGLVQWLKAFLIFSYFFRSICSGNSLLTGFQPDDWEHSEGRGEDGGVPGIQQDGNFPSLDAYGEWKYWMEWRTVTAVEMCRKNI